MANKAAEARKVTSRFWPSPGVLDQGNTSQCVAYSGVKYLTTAPIYNEPIAPLKLYKECLDADEWPGNDLDNGTSVRALFKVLKRRGLVSEYRWAFDAATVVNHVLTTGPVVMGTIWTRDMFMPVRGTDYITPTGDDDGGHAWLIIGADRRRVNPDDTRGAIRLINSWGKNWGDNGRAWMKFSDLNKLIKLDGEACIATEISR